MTRATEYIPKQSHLKALWDRFTEIPVDDNNNITKDFLVWPEGTDKFTIWHWFNERYNGGIYALINGERK